MAERKVLFLDRDGVINRKMPEHQYVLRREQFEFLPGVFDALSLLEREGYEMYVVSNQAGVGKGSMTVEDLEGINAWMSEQLAAKGIHLRGIYYCPHRAEEHCSCRKPEPGMLLQAAKEHGIDLKDAIFVGDSPTDKEAGKRAGCRTILMESDGRLMDVVHILMGDKKPLVSIVIPSYNDASVVRDAIESVLGQTYPNVELILVNDGSTDDLEAVINPYLGIERFKYIKQNNSGLSAARNAGLSVAEGDFLLFLDADDFLASDALEKGINFLSKHNEFDLVYFNFFIFKNNNRDVLYSLTLNNPTGYILDYLLSHGHHFNMSRVLLKKKLFRQIKFEKGKFSEDWDFWIAISYYERARFGYLDKRLVYLRQREESLSRGILGRERAASSTLVLFQKWRDILPLEMILKHNISQKIDILAIKNSIAIVQAKGKRAAVAFLTYFKFTTVKGRTLKVVFISLIVLTPVIVQNHLLNYYYRIKTNNNLQLFNAKY